MHQSAVRSARPLAARGCCWSSRQRRSLPFVRRFPPQCAAAARSALAYAPAFARYAPAARPAPALNRAPWSLETTRPAVETSPLLRVLGRVILFSPLYSFVLPDSDSEKFMEIVRL